MTFSIKQKKWGFSHYIENQQIKHVLTFGSKNGTYTAKIRKKQYTPIFFTQFKYNNFSSLILNKIINLIHLLKNVTYCLAPYIIISCLHILLYPFSNCFIRYKPYLFGYFSETITLIVQSVY